MFTINKHRKSKITNRKLFISAQDKFYDLPMICHHLLPSKALYKLLIFSSHKLCAAFFCLSLVLMKISLMQHHLDFLFQTVYDIQAL